MDGVTVFKINLAQITSPLNCSNYIRNCLHYLIKNLILFQMILLRCFLRNGFCPKIIRNGRKILVMEIKNLGLRFLTSNAYFNCNEYELGMQFNLSFDRLFFPKKFCNIIHFDYIGPLPPKELFFSSLDSKDERRKKESFLQNFSKNNRVWNFQKELIHFADQKLFLLTLSCLKFLQDCFEFQNTIKTANFLNSGLVHPFGFPLCTLGGFTFKLFKISSLNKFPIFVVNNEFGLRTKKVSKIEYEWSCLMEYLHPEKIFQGAFNNPRGQKYFKETIPDLYSPITKEALFFNGCVFHGHFNNCLLNPNANETTKSPFGKTFKELNDEFDHKTMTLIQNHPDDINEVNTRWECQYKQLREKPEAQFFLKNLFKPHPLYRLKPRDCVKGAYFDVFHLCWSETENPNENMYFLDINGLYSFCAINFKFMIGKYHILLGNALQNLSIQNNKFFFENKHIMGTILLTITAPKTLFYPFLSSRIANGKTVNTLCSQCANKQNKKCFHTDNERAITGSYMLSEIEFALSLGYQILCIHECHVYEENDFILKDFVKILNMLKTKHSDFLKGLTREQQLLYCESLNKTLGLNYPFCLSPENVQFNSQKRFFYKLMANSLFGKLEQKNNKYRTIFANKQSDLENIFYSENVIEDLYCISDDICEVKVLPNELKLPPNRGSNCYIGAQVTAYAREIIYRHLQTLVSKSAKIFQVDCDSIIFTLPKGQQIPLNISEAVGDFKHEIKGKIISYCSLGPKNYSISFENESEQSIKTISKVSGLALNNHLNSFSFDTKLFKEYIDQILKKKSERCLVNQFRKKGNFKKMKITCEIEKITFSNDLSKRRFVNNYITYPYGFNN